MHAWHRNLYRRAEDALNSATEGQRRRLQCISYVFVKSMRLPALPIQTKYCMDKSAVRCVKHQKRQIAKRMTLGADSGAPFDYRLLGFLFIL